MKIFISHSSLNANYGNALVDLLTAIGVNSNDIIFTSNDAFGIPIGQNIFNWLKNRINEKPFVLYLLSPQYYESVACLNEMGAAWIVENDHAMVFTPHFDLKSYEFQNGALDPREIGFYINNENRLISFIESLKKSFDITNNPVLLNQKIKHFIAVIEPFNKNEIISKPQTREDNTNSIKKVEEQTITHKKLLTQETNNENTNLEISRYYFDFTKDNLKDEEILLAKYIIDTDRFKLGAGWQESNEIANIKIWEDIHELNDKLSNNYNGVLRRFEMKKMTNVSDVTSHGNPKEVCIVEEFRHELLNPRPDILEKIKEVTGRNSKGTYTF